MGCSSSTGVQVVDPANMPENRPESADTSDDDEGEVEVSNTENNEVEAEDS